MSVWNKIAGVVAATTLFAAPAFADGVPGQQVNRGPAPLKAHAMTPPEPGCIHVRGNEWKCPVPAARFTQAPATTYRAAPVTRTTSSRTHTSRPTTTRRHTTSTRTYAPATTTRTVTRSAPTVTRRATSSTRTVSQPVRRPLTIRPQQMVVDISGFNGGVGAGLGGEPVFGGGTIFFGGDKRYSGVLSHGASAFTFQQRSRGGKGGHKPHHPKPKPCGGCH